MTSSAGACQDFAPTLDQALETVIALRANLPFLTSEETETLRARTIDLIVLLRAESSQDDSIPF
jgi:hypothetical protein